MLTDFITDLYTQGVIPMCCDTLTKTGFVISLIVAMGALYLAARDKLLISTPDED